MVLGKGRALCNPMVSRFRCKYNGGFKNPCLGAITQPLTPVLAPSGPRKHWELYRKVYKEIFTFAHICVEMDLNKTLPDCIPLIHKDLKWSQTLDFENTTFRCRVCHQTRHLQNSCTLAGRKTTKKTQKKKGWNFPDVSLSDKEEEETVENQR